MFVQKFYYLFLLWIYEHPLCFLSVFSAVSGVQVKIKELHDSKPTKHLSKPLYLFTLSKTLHYLYRLCCHNLVCHFSGPFLHSTSWDTQSCFHVCPSSCCMAFVYKWYWYIQHISLEPANIPCTFSSLHVEVPQSHWH